MKLKRRIFILFALLSFGIFLVSDNKVYAKRDCRSDCDAEKGSCLGAAEDEKIFCYSECDNDYYYWFELCANYHCGGPTGNPTCVNPCYGEAEMEVSYCKGSFCDNNYSFQATFCSNSYDSCVQGCP